MTTTTQLVQTLRFCETNRPAFVSVGFWDTAVLCAVTDFADVPVERFNHMDVYWKALESVRHVLTEMDAAHHD